AITTIHQVVHRPRILNAQFAWHGSRLSPPPTRIFQLSAGDLRHENPNFALKRAGKFLRRHLKVFKGLDEPPFGWIIGSGSFVTLIPTVALSGQPLLRENNESP